MQSCRQLADPLRAAEVKDSGQVVRFTPDDSGPYKKYGDNPLMKGHGQFCWRYSHGVLMIPHHQNWIHWSEDGIHFAAVANDPNIVRFGALYVPGDPLFGEPAGVEPSTRYWGFETIDKPRPGDQRPDPDVEAIEFGSVS